MSAETLYKGQNVGLALEGGGGKGGYQLGCWKAFLEHGIRFDVISGCSIGALNGAFICQGDYEKAEAFWLSLSTRNVCRIDHKKMMRLLIRLLTDLGLILVPFPMGKFRFLRYARYLAGLLKALSRAGGIPFLVREGLFDLSDVKGSIESYLDINVLRTGKIDLYISVYQVSRLYPIKKGKTIFHRARDLEPGQLREFLTASVAIPLVFPSMEINRFIYLDGQLGRPDLLSPLADTDLKTIYVVHLRPPPPLRAVSLYGPEAKPSPLGGVGSCLYEPEALKGKGSVGVKNGKSYAFKIKDSLGREIIHIFPTEDIGGFYKGTLDFDQKGIERRIELGYRDVQELLKNPAGAFPKGLPEPHIISLPE